MSEIVLTGTLASLEKLRSNASPELLSISTYPRLDPKRALRIFKKLQISSVEALHKALESGILNKPLVRGWPSTSGKDWCKQVPFFCTTRMTWSCQLRHICLSGSRGHAR